MTFVIRLVAIGGNDRTSVHALRRLLKVLLRRYGFKCIGIREDRA